MISTCVYCVNYHNNPLSNWNDKAILVRKMKQDLLRHLEYRKQSVLK